eukprot:COSAG04_NODE_534_length_12949_cov_5.651673_8_plen_134_part_00
MKGFLSSRFDPNSCDQMNVVSDLSWYLGCILGQECQQQSCEQEGATTGDGKEEIFDEAMLEVRILQMTNSSGATWKNISVHTWMNIDQAHNFVNATTFEIPSDEDGIQCEIYKSRGGEAAAGQGSWRCTVRPE